MKTKIKVSKIIFIASIVVAVFFAIQSLGEKMLTPFPAEVNLNMPTITGVTDDGEMLIADNDNTRLVFCDKDGKACNIINLTGASEISKATNILGDGNSFYVGGIKYKRNTSIVASEKILRFDADGKNPALLYEKEGEDNQRFPLLAKCAIYDNRLFTVIGITKTDSLGSIIEVLSVDTDPNTNDIPQHIFTARTETSYLAQYIPKKGQLYVNDYFGNVFCETNDICEQINTNKPSARVFVADENGLISYSDTTNWNLYIDDKKIAENVVATNLTVADDKVFFDNGFDGSLSCYDRSSGDTNSFRKVDFSAGLWIITFMKAASFIYLAVLLIVLIIGFLIKAVRNKGLELLKKIGLVVAGIAAAVSIAFFYTNRIYQTKATEVKNNLTVMGSFMAETLKSYDFSQTVETIDQIREKKTYDSEFKEEYLKNHQFYSAYINAEDAQGTSTYIILYGKHNNKYRIIYDSTGWEQFGETVDYVRLIDVTRNEGRIFTNSIQGMEVISCMSPVYDSAGEIKGFIEIGQDSGVLSKRFDDDVLELSLELMTIIVALYLFITEGRHLISGLKERKMRLAKDNPNAELATMRSLNFFFSLVTAFDGVILVLITKEMLEAGNFPPESVTWLMALPTTLFGIGSPIGTVLYNILARRFKIRKVSICSVVVMAASYVFIIPVIMRNLFFVFCLLKFVGGVANGIAYNMISSMPYRTEDEKDRYNATKDKAMGHVSSSVLGALIGGLIAQRFGNISLYVVNAIAFVPLLLLILAVMPRDCIYIPKTTGGRNALKNFGKFIISAPMISYFLFLTVPLMVTQGYKSFLFPLYSTAMEMPKIYVTGFYVLARTIAMIINKPVTNAIKDIDHWKIAVLGMAAMGIAFMGFSLNSTIVWAVIMLFINALFDKIVSSSKAMLWPRQAGNAGLSAMETTGYISILERFIFSLKETILTIFLLFGNKGACTAVGVFCMICTLLFAFITYRSPMMKTEN